jgi:hypothetical protein
VCTENLNPNVLMMKSAQDSVRTYDAGSLYRPRNRRIFMQRSMRSDAVVIIGGVRFQNAAQMLLAEDNEDCKSPFVSPITNFPGCRRGDRKLMWGTTSFCDELTGDFGGAFEATSIDGCRLFCRLAEI